MNLAFWKKKTPPRRPKERVVVLAGSYEQFRMWCVENDYLSHEVICADSEFKIMGFRGLPIIRVGTWNENPVASHPYVKNRERLI